MIEVKEITIKRGEGPSHLCRITKTYHSYHEANIGLIRSSPTLPSEGGYDKHNFTVEFEDGYKYEGRLDCKAVKCRDNDLDVARHIRETQMWYAGKVEYPHCGKERYEEMIADYREQGWVQEAEDFLAKYDCGQN